MFKDNEGLTILLLLLAFAVFLTCVGAMAVMSIFAAEAAAQAPPVVYGICQEWACMLLSEDNRVWGVYEGATVEIGTTYYLPDGSTMTPRELLNTWLPDGTEVVSWQYRIR